MIDYIFSNDWSDINQIVEYLEKNDIKSFSQGFFTKVFLIGEYVLKVNCGDIDNGFKEYVKYIVKNPSIHAPIIYQYKEINGHYLMLTELLKPMICNVEPVSITFLRELIKSNLYDIENTKLKEKFESMLSKDELKQVYEIFSFFKDFNNSEMSIDICLENIMVRNNTWVINDPLVQLNLQ